MDLEKTTHQSSSERFPGWIQTMFHCWALAGVHRLIYDRCDLYQLCMRKKKKKKKCVNLQFKFNLRKQWQQKNSKNKALQLDDSNVFKVVKSEREKELLVGIFSSKIRYWERLKKQPIKTRTFQGYVSSKMGRYDDIMSRCVQFNNKLTIHSLSLTLRSFWFFYRRQCTRHRSFYSKTNTDI